MKVDKIFRVGIFLCRIKRSFFAEYFNAWASKIDPFLDTPGESGRIITISSKKGWQPQIVKILRRTHLGFFEGRITEDAERIVYFQLVRKVSKKIYFTFAVAPDFREIFLLEDNTTSCRDIPFEYLGQIVPHAGIHYGQLTFHGVLLEHQGRGIILSAPSGTGKTTHARMWRDDRNALIINGDRAACAKTEGVWTGYGLPWSGTSGEQINRSVPVFALVVLERGDRNEAVRVTDPLEAFFAVLPQVQYPSWDKDLSGKAMDLLEDFLRSVPVIRLRCLPEPAAVDVLAEALEALSGKGA